MACNCKKTAENAAKYSDDGKTVDISQGISKISVFILRLLTVVLAAGLIIVILPFFLAYVLFCMIIGREIRLDMTKMFKRNV